MMPDNQLFSARRAVVLVLAIMSLLISVDIYLTRANSYSPATQTVMTYQPQVTNAEVLHNWLPSDVYLYTLARIDDYLRVNNLASSSLTVVDGVHESDIPTYYFDVIILPAGQKLTVGVSVSNESAVLATTVTINQQLQTPQVPSAQHSRPGTTIYNGFDALINAGLTATQSDELRQALETFAPSANKITINPASINSGELTSDGTTRPYTFILSIDNMNYKATLNTIGLLKSQLLLAGTNDRQVFDSGVISQGS